MSSALPPILLDASLNENGLAPPLPLPPDSVYTSCYCEENVYLLANAFTAEASNAPTSRESWPWETWVVFVSNSGKTVALWSQKARAGVVVWDYHVFLVLRPRPQRLRALPHTATIASSHVDQQACAPSPQLRPLPNPSLVNTGPVLIEREGDQAWVYDFDTTLAVPCPWRAYVAGTFPYAFDDALSECVDSQFLSLFRVIPADEYLDHFASDRSHMIVPGAAERSMLSACGTPSGEGVEGMEDTGSIDDGGMADEQRYSMPPPPYPPICGAKAKEMGVVHNLMESFVAMDIKPASQALAVEEGRPSASSRVGLGSKSPVDTGTKPRSTATVQYGQVMDMRGFLRWVSGERELLELGVLCT